VNSWRVDQASRTSPRGCRGKKSREPKAGGRAPPLLEAKGREGSGRRRETEKLADNFLEVNRGICRTRGNSTPGTGEVPESNRLLLALTGRVWLSEREEGQAWFSIRNGPSEGRDSWKDREKPHSSRNVLYVRGFTREEGGESEKKTLRSLV